MDITALAGLLRETEQRHGAFDSTAPKHNWWDWYAAYMHAREHGQTPDDASISAGQYMASFLAQR